MSLLHVKGSAGNDANNGSTWALAKATIAAAAALAANGDTIFCDASASENSSATQTVNIGSETAPCNVISGTPDTTTGITALASGYTWKVSTGTFDVVHNGYAYVRGITYISGTGSNTASLAFGQTGDAVMRFMECNFRLEGSSTSNRINIGIGSSVDASRVEWNNCGAYFSNASQGFSIRNAEFDWNGGSILSGSTTPASLFGSGSLAGRISKIRVTGVDLSNLSSGFNFLGSNAGTTLLTVRGCKLPASWSGDLAASATLANWRAEMYDCDTANNGYVRFWIKDRHGEVKQNTTITRTGSGDGIADFSMQITGTSHAVFPAKPFATHEQFLWNAATGSSKTLTVELCANSALTDGQVALRARYYSSTGAPLMTVVSSEASPIVTPSALTTSAVSWNGSPSNKYKLQLTFTPQRAGYVIWDILSFTTTPIYVDPNATIA